MDIKSGEVQAEITTEYPAKNTEEEIAAIIKKNIEDELKSYIPHENIDKDTFKQEFLIPNANYHANQYRKHTETEHLTTLFQMIKPISTDSGIQFQYKLTMLRQPGHSLNSEVAQNHHASELILLAYDNKTQVRQSIGNLISSGGSVEIEDSNVWYGFLGYSFFGRSLHQVPEDAQIVGKETVDGAKCHVLEYTIINKWKHKERFKIWVDKSINWGIRKVVRFRGLDTNDVYMQLEYRDFQLIEDVWFPEFRTQTTFNKDNTLRSHMTIKITSVDFGIHFPKGFFKIDRNY